MNWYKKSCEVILLLLLAWLLNNLLSQTGAYSYDVSIGLTTLFYTTMFLGVWVWVIVTDISDFRKLKKYISFLPTLISLLLMVQYSTRGLEIRSKERAPIFIEAHSNGPNPGSIELTFRTDGNFQYRNSGPGGSQLYYGRYTINDSIIKLDNSGIGKVLYSKNLVIRKKPNGPSHFYKELYQILDNGKTIDNAVAFHVIPNNN